MYKLLENGRIWNPDGSVRPGRILVGDEVIVGVYGTDEPLPRTPDLLLDLQEQLVFPSLINAHDHLYDTFWPQVFGNSRYQNWYEWDQEYRSSQTYRQKQMLSTADLYSLGMYRNALSGVGLVVDHFPREIVATFARKPIIGLLENFFLAHSVSSHKLDWGDGVREEFAQARGVLPFCVHIEEGFDSEISQEVETLHRLGALGDNTILVNGVGLSASDIELIATRRASLVWCPASLDRLYNAMPPILKLREAGIPLALGTDAVVTGSMNLFEELRWVREYCRNSLPGKITDRELLDMVTLNPARMFRVEKTHGSIEAGKLANFLVFSDHRQSPLESFFELTPKDVSMLIHRGALVYGDERFRSVCAMKFDHFSEVLVDGSPKIIWGKPVQLLERIEYKLGEARRFPFLPLAEA